MISETLEIAEISAPARDASGRLLPGHNMGRPKNSTNKAGRAEVDRLRARSEAVWAVVDKRLAEGCAKTALFLLSRLLPDCRIVDLESNAPDAVADAVTDGTLTPTEAGKIASAVKLLKDAAGVDEMRTRLDEIESLLIKRKGG